MTRASMPDPVAWRIRFAISGDFDQIDYHSQNAIGDYRAIYPDATSTPLITTDQAEAYAKVREALEWQPIETTPKDRPILLGRFNAHGKWRTMRGQWFSKEHIDENWDDADGFESGWYETSVEADDAPNCWPTTPSHWIPLPAPPSKRLLSRIKYRSGSGPPGMVSRGHQVSASAG